MNRKARKQFENSRHEMYMFKAAWLAFLGRELARVKQPNVVDFIQGVDGAIRSAVDAVAAGEVVSIRVEIWKQTDMFEQMELAGKELSDLLKRAYDSADMDEMQRIEEELRRQESDDKPYPF